MTPASSNSNVYLNTSAASPAVFPIALNPPSHEALEGIKPTWLITGIFYLRIALIH